MKKLYAAVARFVTLRVNLKLSATFFLEQALWLHNIDLSWSVASCRKVLELTDLWQLSVKLQCRNETICFKSY